jgi:WD40 repeat protein
MDKHVSNIEIINRITDNNYSFMFEGRPYYLLLHLLENSLQIELRKDNSIIPFKSILMFSDLKKHPFFNFCQTIHDIHKLIVSMISQGKLNLKDKDTYFDICLFDKNFDSEISFNIILKEAIYDNILNGINMKPILNNQDNEMFYKFSNLFKEHNEEIKLLKEEIKQYKIQNEIEQVKLIKFMTENVAVKVKDSYKSNITILLHLLILLMIIMLYIHQTYIFASINEKIDSQKINPCNVIDFNENILNNKVEDSKEPYIANKNDEIRNMIVGLKYSDMLTLSKPENKIYSYHIYENYIVTSFYDQIKILKSIPTSLNQNIKSKLKGYLINYVILNDGNIATSDFNYIKIFDSKNEGTRLYELSGHSKPVRYLTVLKKGLLASASNDYTIKIWDSVNNYKCIHTLPEAHKGSINKMVNLPNGYLVTASSDKFIKIWDNEYKLVSFISLPSKAYSVLVLPNGYIVTGWDSTIKVWQYDSEYNNLTSIKTLNGHTHTITELFLFKDRYILSGSNDTTIRVWDIEDDYNCINILRGHTSSISNIYSLDDDTIVSVAGRIIIHWK